MKTTNPTNFTNLFFPESVRIFLLNLLNRCEPKSTHKSGIRVGLKCPPASVRFNTIKKISEICGIGVSPKNTHKSGIRVSLKCPPASVRFNTLKSKTCEICGIRVSPKNTHKSEIRVSPKNTTKAGIRVKKKAPRVGWVPLPSEPFLEKNY